MYAPSFSRSAGISVVQPNSSAEFSLRWPSVLMLVMSLFLASCGGNSTTSNGSSAQAAQPEAIRLDYAYYNPLSLVLKEKGWLEQDLA
ncbi:MAG TPA: hypothetical protein VF598_08575, partial [Hymenobacter sp.]